jgi:hypothetical protein
MYEKRAAMIDNTVEMIKSKLKLSMKIGANVLTKVSALTPGGARPRNTENKADDAGTLARAVPRKWLSSAMISIAK